MRRPPRCGAVVFRRRTAPASARAQVQEASYAGDAASMSATVPDATGHEAIAPAWPQGFESIRDSPALGALGIMSGGRTMLLLVNPAAGQELSEAFQEALQFGIALGVGRGRVRIHRTGPSKCG